MDQVQVIFGQWLLLDYRLVMPPNFTSDYVESKHKVSELLGMQTKLVLVLVNWFEYATGNAFHHFPGASSDWYPPMADADVLASCRW